MASRTPTAQQQHAVDLFAGGGNVVVEALAGTGKTSVLRMIGEQAHRAGRRGLYVAFNRALREDQPVATPSGWRKIRDLRPGDAVMGRDGTSCMVTAIHDRRVRPMFRLVFSDGTKIVADGEHLWDIERTHTGNTTYVVSETVTTDEIRDHLARARHVRVPMTMPLSLPRRRLPVDPYLLGALLGDGSFIVGSVTFTNTDDWMQDEIARLLPATISAKATGCPPAHPRKVCGLTTDLRPHPGVNPLINALRDMGLFGRRGDKKFIPDEYLWSSRRQRLALLQGLMDTDGCPGASGGVTPMFTSTSPWLAASVQFLTQSLGGVATMRQMWACTARWAAAYQVTVRLPSGIPVFRRPSKVARVRARSHDRLLYRRVVSVTEAEPARAVCIDVDAPDHLFLTAGLIPTHNCVAVEAQERFAGTGVTARTMHSLAFDLYGRPMRHRLENRKPVQWSAKAAVLGVDGRYAFGPLDGSAVQSLSRQRLVGMVTETVRTFLHSPEPDVTPAMVPVPATVGVLTADGDRKLREAVVGFARRYWQDLCDPDGKLRYEHDAYLKAAQLGGLRLPYDYILYDEAQDADRVSTALVRAQDVQVVATGDANQEIYGWRNATSALDSFGGARCALTQTFRFGSEIATEANRWLDVLGSPLRLEGLQGKPSSVWESRRTPEAVLTRTNAGALAEVVESQMAGVPTGIGGGRKAKELHDLAQAALHLQEKGATRHPELQSFGSWPEVVEYADGPDGGDLRPLVRVVEKVGAARVVSAIDGCVPAVQARTVVSTAHTAKGLEWLHVRVSDDFHNPGVRAGVAKPLPAEEARLAYVAVTRATRHLDPSGLWWLGRWRAAGGVAVEADGTVHGQGVAAGVPSARAGRARQQVVAEPAVAEPVPVAVTAHVWAAQGAADAAPALQGGTLVMTTMTYPGVDPDADLFAAPAPVTTRPTPAAVPAPAAGVEPEPQPEPVPGPEPETGRVSPVVAAGGYEALSPAGRIAALTALRDALDTEVTALKKGLVEQFAGATKNTPLPTPLGALSFQPGTTPVVIDDDALLAYVKRTAPDKVTTVTQEVIDPDYRKGLVADLVDCGDGDFARGSTGEAVDYARLGKPRAGTVGWPASKTQKLVKAFARDTVRDNLDRLCLPILASAAHAATGDRIVDHA